jgi:hypothetical protein
MSIPLFTLKEMPENCFVVRIKKTGQYIHYNNDNDDVFIKQKMCGCLVLRNKEDAENIINSLHILEKRMYNLTDIELTSYECVPFEQAYKEHGIVEKQIVLN